MAGPDVTRLLEQHAAGDAAAAAQLLPLLYKELQALARGMMGGERANHTLQATAVVNEAFLRLITHGQPVENRSHFFRLASREMRHVLIEHARSRKRLRRGGSKQRMPLDQVTVAVDDRAVDLLALEEALGELAKADPRKVEIVEMRFFGGLNNTEIARALDMPLRTVERKWAVARSRLFLLMGGEGGVCHG